MIKIRASKLFTKPGAPHSATPELLQLLQLLDLRTPEFFRLFALHPLRALRANSLQKIHRQRVDV
jgi:hypothetical protein